MQKTEIKTLLVANRGEIALRIMRTAKSLGIATIAIYAKADADAPHRHFADEAIFIGDDAEEATYLNADKIIAAAKQAKADAIHPGYGFLSENADFAEAVRANDIIFVGPPSEAIALMGNKAAAKQRMIEAGVPCVPGYEGEDQTDANLIAQAEKIGLPLMVKAAAGGGGRGMRFVLDKNDLQDAIKTARVEAENAFGSGELILEKAISSPRHVEVQLIGDQHGNILHLGERDCSVQRRHQKVIEESPCPIMTDKLRADMGAAAVAAAKGINYFNAGTVEFLLDESGAFYFLEMNTRLQVEHPITECVTGLDLVAMQLQVASGQPLGLAQSDISLAGHAIEVRLYAEDPMADFQPKTGIITHWQEAQGAGIRNDAGIVSGQAILPFYDPMLAKIIAQGANREEARQRLIAALKETILFGLPNNRDFLIACLAHPIFAAGKATTDFLIACVTTHPLFAAGKEKMDFLQTHFDMEAWLKEQLDKRQDKIIIAILSVLYHLAEYKVYARAALHTENELLNFNSGAPQPRVLRLNLDQTTKEAIDINICPLDANHYEIMQDGEACRVRLISYTDKQAVLEANNKQFALSYQFVADEGQLFASIDGQNFTCMNLYVITDRQEEIDSGTQLVSPIHGSVTDIFVKADMPIQAGGRLAIIEAMKMQHEITARIDGHIRKIHIETKQQVASGDLLFEIEPIENEAR